MNLEKYVTYDDEQHTFLFKGLNVNISNEAVQDLMGHGYNHGVILQEMERRYTKLICVLRENKINEILNIS